MSEIDALISLLADDDPETTRETLAALLNYDDTLLAGYIRANQESADPRVRRHIHQLEAILTLRSRRRSFAARLADPDTDLLEGLIEVHLQWYDNDNPDVVRNYYRDFLTHSRKFDLTTMNRLADYMRRNGFTAPEEKEITFPEHYCLGSVLDSRRGADVILCAVARSFAAAQGLEVEIARFMGTFVLINRSSGELLTPEKQWRLTEHSPSTAVVCRNNQILRYVMQMLFSYAVEANSFRYIHTLYCAITGEPDNRPPEYLPYPFNPNNPPPLT